LSGIVSAESFVLETSPGFTGVRDFPERVAKKIDSQLKLLKWLEKRGIDRDFLYRKDRDELVRHGF
jgi:hypothetical protein